MTEPEKTCLGTSPIAYADVKLAEFMEMKLYCFRADNPPAGPISAETMLKVYRSAKDKHEPTKEQLMLRVKLAYLYEYEKKLKEYIKSVKKEASSLKATEVNPKTIHHEKK